MSGNVFKCKAQTRTWDEPQLRATILDNVLHHKGHVEFVHHNKVLIEHKGEMDKLNEARDCIPSLTRCMILPYVIVLLWKNGNIPKTVLDLPGGVHICT